ncbi:putative S-layer protein [Candidatus Pacearchaeota archaeon]|nr:putative S-layer protein [Candidatus Pacearchaeota archaeon]
MKMSSMKLLSVLSILTLLTLSLSFASALTLSNPSNDLTMAANNATVTLTNNDAVAQNVTLSVSNIVSGGNQVLMQVTPQAVDNFAVSGTSSLKALINSIVGEFEFGSYTATLSAVGVDASTGVSVANATRTLTFVQSFCENGETGSLEITNINIDNQGEGRESSWNLLDTIEIEVDFENNGNDDLNDIFVELGLIDSTGKNQANDLDFENADEEQFDYGDLNEGDDDTVTFTFRVPADFEDGNYKLAVKVYSDDSGEDIECADTSNDLDQTFYHDLDIERENDEGRFIAFENTEINPEEVTCGDTVRLSTDVFNIGDEDQDQVKITLENSELKLNLEREIRNDLDQGDKEAVNFDFIIPEGTQNKVYNLELGAEYDYNRGSYRQSSDESTTFQMRVIGCEAQAGTGSTGGTGSTSGRVSSVTATLESGAKEGSQVVVKAKVTNIGKETESFVLDAKGYDSWATLDSISSRILTVEAGQSRDVIFTFDANEDSAGEQSFIVEVRSGDKIETKEVVVDIEAADSSSGDGFSFDLGDNTLIWVIGIINVLLIILIIVVAVRISRK